MIEYTKFKIISCKSTLILIGISFLLLFIGLPIFAQTVSAKPKLAYPATIPNVGSCTSWADCRKLCADPVNTQACSDWAISQQLVQPKATIDQVIQQAKSQLGCPTKEECISLCSQKENYEKCTLFAREKQLPGGYDKLTQNVTSVITNPAKQQQVAEELKALMPNYQPGVAIDLKNLCQKSENRTVCSSLAQKMGISGGSIVSDGPGGCKSAQTCTRYCISNAADSACKVFLSKVDQIMQRTAIETSGPQSVQSTVGRIQKIQEEIAGGASKEQFEAEINDIQKKLIMPLLALPINGTATIFPATHTPKIVYPSASSTGIPVVTSPYISPTLMITTYKSPTPRLTEDLSPTPLSIKYQSPTHSLTRYPSPTPTQYSSWSPSPSGTTKNNSQPAIGATPTTLLQTWLPPNPSPSNTAVQGVSTYWGVFDWIKLFINL